MKSFEGRKSLGSKSDGYSKYKFITLKYKRKYVILQASKWGSIDACSAGYLTVKHFADNKRQPEMKFSANCAQFYQYYAKKDPWIAYSATDEEIAWLKKCREAGEFVDEPKGNSYDIF